jgi:hypothetical protein
MDADETVSLLPLVEGGDVGKADDGALHSLRSLGLQSLQKPQRPIAPAGTEHGADGRICESAIQLREPALIVASQVPVSPEYSGVVLNAVAAGNNGEPRVE